MDTICEWMTEGGTGRHEEEERCLGVMCDQHSKRGQAQTAVA